MGSGIINGCCNGAWVGSEHAGWSTLLAEHLLLCAHNSNLLNGIYYLYSNICHRWFLVSMLDLSYYLEVIQESFILFITYFIIKHTLRSNHVMLWCICNRSFNKMNFSNFVRKSLMFWKLRKTETLNRKIIQEDRHNSNWQRLVRSAWVPGWSVYVNHSLVVWDGKKVHFWTSSY